MVSYIQNFFGGGATTSSEPLEDVADFADFATPAASMASDVANAVTSGAMSAASSVSSVVAPADSTGAATGAPAFDGAPTTPPVVFTKWYRVWERTSLSDWYVEMVVVPVVFLVVLFHFLGRRRNRNRARGWAQANLSLLQDQFALVGYGRTAASQPAASDSKDEIVGANIGSDVLREVGPDEFAMYASGRENVAFTDITLKLMKWHSPFQLLIDMLLGCLWESFEVPAERVEATAYSFDGREKDLVPALGPEKEAIERKAKGKSSVYDGFVFGIMHKNLMRKHRESRYDLSLTQAKDSPKLPSHLTVLSESQEITNAMLTPELVKAIEKAGDYFEWILVTDQPVAKPTTLEEATPRKRVSVSLRLPPGSSSDSFEAIQPIFRQFVGMTDYLVQIAHLRPEALRKVRQTREDDIRRLRRAEEAEKAEERKIATEKLKKEERDRLLRNMSAEEQKKFLEKEKEKETRKMMKKSTRKA